MKFLIDANLPRSTASLLRSLGHEAGEVREVLPNGATDSQVAAHAQKQQAALLTRDFDFADIRNYPPNNFFGLVVVQLPDDAGVAQINKTVESFVTKPELLRQLIGRLAIVESWRVRFRPA